MTAGQTVAKAADLLVVMLLVRVLSPADWATMALLLSIYSVAIGLGGLNLHQGIYFFFGRAPEPGRRSLAVQTTGLLAASGALTALVILALGPVLADAPYQVSGWLPWLALAVLLEVPTLGAPQLLIAAERVGASAAFMTAASLLRVVAVSLPIWLGMGLRGGVAGLLLYAVVRLGAYAVVVLRVTPPGPVRLDAASIRQQLAYTLPLGLSMATSLINRDVGKWMVAAFAPASFGAYAIAATEVPLISMLPYAIGAVLATRFVAAFQRGQRQVAQSYFLAAAARASLIVIPATVGIILCAPQLLILLFTPAYAAAVLPFQVFSVILLHRVTEYGGILRAAGDTRALWLAGLVLLIGNVVISLPLTLRFGMVGTAAGALAANLLSWLYALRRISGILRVSLAEVFPWRPYAQVLTVALAAAAGVALLARLLPPQPVIQLAFKASLFVLAFLGAVGALRLRHGLPRIPAEVEPAGSASR